MTIDRISDYVLVSISYGLVSLGPGVNASFVLDWYMRNDYCDLSLLLKFVERLVQPGKDSPWVVSLGPEVEVKDIARLGVHSYNVNLIVDFAIG